MKKLKLRLLIMVLSIIAISKANICSAQVDTAIAELGNIYRSYDSLHYLTFDVTYTYDSDTLYGNFTHDALMGTYTMNGKKALYKLGGIDFMQNESFLIAVYNKDKFIIVSDPPTSNAGSYLPLRSEMDSLFAASLQHYTVEVTPRITGIGSKHERSIILRASDSLAKFARFVITYGQSNHFIKSLQYSFIGRTDNVEYDTKLSDSMKLVISKIPRRKDLSIEFSKYRFDNTATDLYSENNYIFYEDKICKPISKYSEYKVFYTKKD